MRGAKMGCNEQIEFDYMDNEKYIYKSNNLVESSYSLSLNAQRLIYMGAKKLKPIFIKSDIKPSQLNSFLATKTFGDLKIYVTEFKNEFNIKGNYLYETLVDVAKELWDSKIQYLSNDGKIIEKRWVITCEYDPKNCCISLTFHPDLILDLLVFKNKYNKIQHNATKALKNSDQIRTYELLKRYVKRGVRRFELEDYRYKLAYDDDIYPEYSKLKQRKIKPTIKAINENTDIEIYDFKEIRYGRKVGAIEFYIRDNKEAQLEENEELIDDSIDPSHVENVNRIVGKNLSAGMVSKITNISLNSIKDNHVDMTVYEYIEDKVKAVRNYARSNTIRNYMSVFLAALRENWDSEIITIQNQLWSGEQRNYSDEYMDDLERKLLGWDE